MKNLFITLFAMLKNTTENGFLKILQFSELFWRNWKVFCSQQISSECQLWWNCSTWLRTCWFVIQVLDDIDKRFPPKSKFARRSRTDNSFQHRETIFLQFFLPLRQTWVTRPQHQFTTNWYKYRMEKGRNGRLIAISRRALCRRHCQQTVRVWRSSLAFWYRRSSRIQRNSCFRCW